MVLFVANLNFKISDQDLKKVFEKFGPVISAKVVRDRKTHRSKGYGFVDMENDEDAQHAIKKLNGKEIMGRPVIVKEAKDKSQ
ncbi:MAG: RNA-binding protein [Bacteroidales bacterium]|nr:RNA-binding protein [Bacteroidales bacterium]